MLYNKSESFQIDSIIHRVSDWGEMYMLSSQLSIHQGP